MEESENSEETYKIIPCFYHLKCACYNPTDPKCNTEDYEKCTLFKQRQSPLEILLNELKIK